MKPKLWLILGLVACGISSLYMHRVLQPWRHFVGIESGKLKAEMGDLYPRWVGTREFIFNGRNPYGPYVSHEIQMGFYGHIIVQDYEDSNTRPVDEQRFAYPLYVVFLLLPTAYLNFATVQQWAPAILAMLTAIGVFLWMDVLRWKPSRTLAAAIALLVLSSPQVMQGLRLRQLGLAVAFLLALGTWCIIRNKLVIAGIVLAVATIKPQMAILPVAWLLFWALSGLRKRWPLVASFTATFGSLAGLAEILLPRWPIYFLEGLAAYRKYFPTTSLLCAVLGNIAGAVFSAIAILALFAIAWRNRRCDALSPEFSKTLMAALVADTLVLPLLTPYNQVLLLLPIMMILRGWAALPKIIRRILASALVWPYVCSIALLVHHPSPDSPSALPLLPSALVLLVPYLVLILFTAELNRRGEQQLLPADSPPVSS